jgi:chromate reductase
LQAAAGLAPPQVDVETYGELAQIPPFDADAEAGGGPEAVRRLRDRVRRASGLLIATPEYNHSIPGVLKNALDWLSRPGPDEVLIGKPVAVVGASAGRWGTRLAQSHLRQVLYATESLVLPAPALFVREAQSLFDAEGVLRDEATRAALRAVLDAFAQWVEWNAGRRVGLGPPMAYPVVAA